MTNSIYSIIIIESLKKGAQRFGKPISWFRYASKHAKNGEYRFLAHKEAQIKLLERIAMRLNRRLPCLTTGQIMDVLSEYVNTV
jgi:hypothetical protein